MVASPEHIEQVIELFARAEEANQATSTRQGNMVCLGPDSGDDVMVTTDIHGDTEIFDRLLAIADLEHNTRRHLVMQEVCHGGPTYPGAGGCMSHLMVEDVAELKTLYRDRFHFILSNHELAEVMEFPISKKGKMLNLSFRFGMQAFFGSEADRVREAMLAFIRSCPLGIRVGDGIVITHSAPGHIARDGFDADVFNRQLAASDWQNGSAVFRLVWGRDFSAENGAEFAKLMNADVLIHGHEPCQEGFAVPNRHQVIIDSCGSQAHYVILPTDRVCSQTEVVERIRRLHDEGPA